MSMPNYQDLRALSSGMADSAIPAGIPSVKPDAVTKDPAMLKHEVPTGYRYNSETYMNYNASSRQSPYATSYGYTENSTVPADVHYKSTNRGSSIQDTSTYATPQSGSYVPDPSAQNQFTSSTQTHPVNTMTGYG